MLKVKLFGFQCKNIVQGDQLCMAVCFWYLVEIDLYCVHKNSSVHLAKSLITRYQKNTVIFTGLVTYELLRRTLGLGSTHRV